MAGRDAESNLFMYFYLKLMLFYIQSLSLISPSLLFLEKISLYKVYTLQNKTYTKEKQMISHLK